MLEAGVMWIVQTGMDLFAGYDKVGLAEFTLVQAFHTFKFL